MAMGEDSSNLTTRGSFSPRQVASALGVSESSLKRWCDQGLIPTTLTPGGHRRLPLHAVLEFARSTNRSLVNAEQLGLPPQCGQQRWSWEAAVPVLVDALSQGADAIARQVILDAFVRGASVAEIGDNLLAPALHQIGDLWECGSLEVYRERRSCRISLRVVLELRQLMPPPPENSPVAIGGTFSGDYYDLPTTLVETVLLQQGYRAASLGSALPAATMISAMRDQRPQLFWVSVSHVADIAEFRTHLRELATAATACGTRLVVGGRAIEVADVRDLGSVQYYDNLQSLAAGEKLPAAAE